MCIYTYGWWYTYPSENYESVSLGHDIPNSMDRIKGMFQAAQFWHGLNQQKPGGFNPSENISQLGWLFSIYGKIKNVPNHQPETHPKLGVHFLHAISSPLAGANGLIWSSLKLPEASCVLGRKIGCTSQWSQENRGMSNFKIVRGNASPLYQTWLAGKSLINGAF